MVPYKPLEMKYGVEANMGMFHKVQVGQKTISPIDWEMSPDMSFGTFESWGGRERVRNNQECVYYFFIDNWGKEPKLCLMERAVKHAKILAEIKAPKEIVEKCVKDQGTSSIFEKSYAIDGQVKDWLINNVLDVGSSEFVVPFEEMVSIEDMGEELPDAGTHPFSGKTIVLPNENRIISDDDIGELIRKWNFYDAEENPSGDFRNSFVKSDHKDVVVDQRTGLMWQRGGLDINSIRTTKRNIELLNKKNFAAFSDWRLPTMEEAMSLMENVKNIKDVHLDPCFSKEQPFVFVSAQRKPGGYWFVDYKQGRAFWSSGTIPGGFARLVRSI